MLIFYNFNVTTSRALKTRSSILILALIAFLVPFQSGAQNKALPIHLDFFGDPVDLNIDPSIQIPVDVSLNKTAVFSFYDKINSANFQPLVNELLKYRDLYQLDDWIYYQLIRNVAQQISPKKENYYRYTFYKWFLMKKSGYDVTLKIHDEKLLFYIRSDEMIYNLPYFMRDNKQFVCLNYHDYGSCIDFENEKFSEVQITDGDIKRSFSYKVKHLPVFHPADYQEKEIKFSLNDNEYDFKVKLNPQIKAIFSNYPVVDYESYFNIPLSNQTYNTLIPALQKTLKGMNLKNGVDYLMRFTRYAFLFGEDSKYFGGEKRLSPEQTLLYDQSDCEDRAALFFYLVKEIYDVPMIVLSFPEHVTIAVKFNKPVGRPILYNGEIYSVCEPTPQKKDLRIGQLLPSLLKTGYEIPYAYHPALH